MASKHWLGLSALLLGVAILCASSLMTGADDITGTVTLNGEPLESGRVQFTPDSNTSGPVVFAPIESGVYRIPVRVEDGVRAGVYEVTIIPSPTMDPAERIGGMSKHAREGSAMRADLRPVEWPVPLEIADGEGDLEANFDLPPAIE